MSTQTHAAALQTSPNWGITPARIEAAVRLIAQTVNPLRIVAFGSWARGEHRPDSDWDVAVVLDESSNREAARNLYTTLQGVDMSMDLLTMTWEHHLQFKDSMNSVHHDIEKEGILVYERMLDGCTSRVTAA